MVEEMKEVAEVMTLNKGDIVKGRITKIEEGQAIIDVGYKYDGVIPIGELSPLRIESVADAVSVGDEVEVKVLRIHEDEGKLILSKKAADASKAWDLLEQRFQNGEVFEVKVGDVVKGGLVADVGVRAFIPASLVERHFVEDFSDYKGKTLRVKVVEFDRNENKVILSQKAVLDEEFERQQQKILSEIQAGEVLEGTVRRLTDFGAFVDLGGIDGLVHISEMAWHRVDNPSEVVKEGDRVKVKVLKVDPDKGRISLSIKEAQPGPWAGVGEKFKPGDIVTGTVKRLVSFGAFVELQPGVEGLVHISQIANKHIATPQEVLEVGQEVKAKVLDVNEKEKRISLSIREVEGDNRRKEVEKFVEKQQTTQGTGVTLGDMFGDLFKKQ
ncbi:30S ribosomal protein S1 [Effusibacillus lacus]|uniref:30S ribosomal protein S1 n=1 Tax=Effusibacillus lacus TaxID=1348429 RepID=A0A292YD18_9BACL|nr:30S ribosomal protein S1 [Effusibacillus lacus]TCS75264.1 SSU ribosomal protein S1P [Effusibacillus lacus]GAX89702.1 30S ribosomal protein S1 [Effusibacillus lacus]